MSFFKILYFTLVIGLFISCKQNSCSGFVKESNTSLNYVNGVLQLNHKPFTGNLVSNYLHGGLKSNICYVKGLKNGLEEHWFKTGILSERRFYKNGIKTGIHRAWWAPGILKFVYHFNNYGAYNGTVTEWYRNGQIYMRFNYKNGKEFGSQKLWESNGVIKANYKVVYGERYGLIGLKKCYKVINKY